MKGIKDIKDIKDKPILKSLLSKIYLSSFLFPLSSLFYSTNFLYFTLLGVVSSPWAFFQASYSE